jgi:hypothetical protein
VYQRTTSSRTSPAPSSQVTLKTFSVIVRSLTTANGAAGASPSPVANRRGASLGPASPLASRRRWRPRERNMQLSGVS